MRAPVPDGNAKAEDFGLSCRPRGYDFRVEAGPVPLSGGPSETVLGAREDELGGEWHVWSETARFECDGVTAEWWYVLLDEGGTIGEYDCTKGITAS